MVGGRSRFNLAGREGRRCRVLGPTVRSSVPPPQPQISECLFISVELCSYAACRPPSAITYFGNRFLKSTINALKEATVGPRTLALR